MGLRLLLKLYPREHRELFGTEMAEVLRQAAEDRRAQGWIAYVWSLAWEAAGLVAGAAAVWAAKLAGQSRLEPVPEMPAAADNIRETEQKIQLCIDCMVAAIATHQFAKARFYSEAERRLRARLENLRGE